MEFCIREIPREKSSPPFLDGCRDIINIVQRTMDGRGTCRCLMEGLPKATRDRSPRDATGCPRPPVGSPGVLGQQLHVWIAAQSQVARSTAVSLQHDSPGDTAILYLLYAPFLCDTTHCYINRFRRASRVARQSQEAKR